MEKKLLSRRDALMLTGGMLAGRAFAQSIPGQTASSLLPLQTTGLEHLGMTVPDQKASAEFYGRIFDPQLFQERDPPPRYYVRLGTAYLAFGGTATPDAPAKIDHVCALVKDYKPDAMRPVLEQAGISVGAGRLGMPTDSDGLRLQLLGVPGGLARTIIPSTRITTDDAAVEAIGLDHVVLAVSDMDKASTYYSKFFGPPNSRSKKPERIWFSVARTWLALEPIAADGKPAIERVCVRIAGYERRAIREKLTKMGVESMAMEDRVRFRDPNGFTIDLKA